MKKKNYDEIDLVDIFIVIKKNFFKVLLITFIFISLMFIYLKSQKSPQASYTAVTKISPISTFEVSNYSTYNSYLKEYFLNKQYKMFVKNQGDTNFEVNLATPTLIDTFTLIGKKNLINLFIDKLEEREIFIDAIKKFDLVNKENFQSKSEYEDQVREIANKINIINKSNKNDSIDGWNLIFQVTDKDKWQSLLYYVEEKANEEVRKYLNENFNRLILHENTLKEYKIEDLEILIKNNKDNLKIQEEFTKDKQILVTDRSTQRLQELFDTTPILDKEKFYASKMIIYSTKYISKTTQMSNKVPLISISIIGFVFGIVYVVIFNSIKKRAKKYKV